MRTSPEAIENKRVVGGEFPHPAVFLNSRYATPQNWPGKLSWFIPTDPTPPSLDPGYDMLLQRRVSWQTWLAFLSLFHMLFKTGK